MSSRDALPPFSAADSGDEECIPWLTIDVVEVDEPPPTRPPVAPTETRPAIRRASTLRDEGEIARGGMGSIRRIYDPELRRHIALKIMESGVGNADARRRFIAEARFTGLLDHPNIVPVHDLVIDNEGAASYTMKLVQGQTLTELIDKQRTLRDLEHILSCLIKACESLAFAHERGVIHRDLKPDNVMIGSHGQVYVMDWGCAQYVGSDRSLVDGLKEEDGLVIGTVDYMAPEQAHGRISQIDARTDVFGVGGMLYRALTGRPPYTGGTMLDKVRLAQAGNVIPPEQVSAGSMKPPPQLSRIAMKAMAKDPKDRFQNTEALARELRSFLKNGNWFPLQIFAPGSVIVREGDPAQAAYVIVKGRCEVHQTDARARGGKRVLRTMHAGEVFGETAIFADKPRSASVVAVDEVSAVVVDRASIEKLTRSSWLGMFVKALADRFLDVDAQLADSRRTSG